ncbi:MAG: UDP-2,3-diacylglucosamine diphosphatase [Saprospiraceae bacterium]|nr:UDP-2,3-diacylglucosamine diphosphatase [Saprospiraceae bacterium]
MKRKIDIAVISDVHLGTKGCHAQELLTYLKSIKPDMLILNGDIIDMWQFKKSYFPKEHSKMLNRLLKMSISGTKIYYITGNHDEALRQFSNLSLGDIHLRDSLSLMIGGKRHWFFHGDVFDTSVIRFPWLAKLGGRSYDFLVGMNKTVNFLLYSLGFEKIAFSKYIKMKVKKAVKFIHDFEQQAIQVAKNKAYDVVVCGHVHTPQLRTEGGILYLNSGDWVENLTALECVAGKWHIYHYHEFASELEKIKDDLLLTETEEEQFLQEPTAAFVKQFL